MGEVLPFTGRFFAVRDWTSSERARIQTLARELKAQGSGVEVVYGTSDAGDPWCVIKDGQENVLIHVARIGSGVVIHDMTDDLVREGRDLWFALSRMISDNDAPLPRGDVMVDHKLDSRHAQLFLAVAVASAFGLDPSSVSAALTTLGDVDLASTDEPYAPTDMATSISTSVVREQHAQEDAAIDPTSLAGHARTIGDFTEPAAAAKVEAPRAPHAAMAPHAEASSQAEIDVGPAVSPPPPPPVVTGTEGDDTIVGTSAAEIIRGGAGNDVISGGGAPTGDVDVIDGGAGDDQISVQSDVVAAGGPGADTFVVKSSTSVGTGSTNLGVIVDFDEADGDLLRFDTVHKVTITSITPVDNVLAEAEAAGATTVSQSASTPGERVGVDVDGDGVEDGYVLVTVVRGRIVLGRGELDVTADGHPEFSGAFASSDLLSIGATIWISADFT